MNESRDALRAWLRMLATAGALKKSIDARLRAQFQVSISRFDILSALDRAGPEGLRAGALSQRLMVTEGNTTQVTAPLVRAGLVRRSTDPGDRRVVIFKLTRKGQRQFTEMAESHRQWVSDAFSSLSPAELNELRRLLDALTLPANAANTGKEAA